MKFRHIVILYTTLLLISGSMILFHMNHDNMQSFDTVSYNNSYKQITQQFSTNGTLDVTKLNPEQLSKLETQYSCKILLLNNIHYEEELRTLQSQQAYIMDMRNGDTLIGKICFTSKTDELSRYHAQLNRNVLFLFAALALLTYLILLVLYLWVIRPFQTLQKVTRQIATGNLDLIFPMKKHNYFGAYTESFDLMREELKKARQAEYEANVSKKELIAELSHDIKTPVATIMATSEVMRLRTSDADMLKKLDVIDSKTSTIHNLINNLFHATLEELQVLKVTPIEEPSTCITEMFTDMQEICELQCENEIPKMLVLMDKLRLKQTIDNIIRNSCKYAKTGIRVHFKEEVTGIKIVIRDFGPGVPEEELANIYQKFYRGTNAQGQDGSGLGLYLSKIFLEEMGGELNCYNENGFVTELFIRKA